MLHLILDWMELRAKGTTLTWKEFIVLWFARERAKGRIETRNDKNYYTLFKGVRYWG